LAKTLELHFLAENGKSSRVTIDNPKEPIDQEVVKQAMEAVIASGIFYTVNGTLVSVNGARVVERNVTDYEIL